MFQSPPNDYYYNDEDDYFSEDDDSNSFVDLPPEIDHELTLREAPQSPSSPPLPPANPQTLQLLRHWFLHDGGQPYLAGGYIELLEKLGGTPSSKDELVKDSKWNKWRLTMPGMEDGDAAAKANGIELERHRSQVRLLRYGEFVERQVECGLGYCGDWVEECRDSEEAVRNDGYPDPFVGEKDMPPQDPHARCDDGGKLQEDELSREQIVELSTCGFYPYVNHTKIHVGLGEGQTDIVQIPGTDVRQFQFEACQETLHGQFRELHDLYCEQRTPLGPEFQFTTNHPTIPRPKPKHNRHRHHRNNNSNSNSNTFSTHPEEISKHTHQLLQTLLSTLQPTGATASLLSSAAAMLSAAAHSDPSVAIALTTPPHTLLRLRKTSLEHAKKTDASAKRPRWAADAWYRAYDRLTELIGDSVRFQAVEGEDGQYKVTAFRPFRGAEMVPVGIVRCAKYYSEGVEGDLMVSVQSGNAVERYSALRQLSRVIVALPFEIAMRFVKDGKKWDVLREACSVGAFREVPEVEGSARKMNERQRRRQDCFEKFAAREAVRFFADLSKHGMSVDDGMGTTTTQVVPGKLTHRIVQNGIVPLLMELADGSEEEECALLSVAAVSGLAQMSRVKDCRLLMWQYPDSVGIVSKLLKTKYLDLMSETMLLVTHLLWDADWAEQLLNIEDTPLEMISIRWATYCMKSIREKAYQLKKEGDDEKMKRAKQIGQKYKLKEGTIEREQVDLQIEQNKKKQENMDHWLDLETDRFRSTTLSSALCRCILVLSTMVQRDPEHLLKINVLHLVACCIDIPTEDHHGGSASLLTNILAWRGAGITPDLFPDPEHLVHSLLDRLESQAKKNKMDRTTSIFTQLTVRLSNAPKWKRYFDLVAKNDEVCRFWINELLPKMCKAFPGGEDEGLPEGVMERQIRQALVHNSCSSLTGKLKQCVRCHKLESKAKEFQSCSRCQIAVYCGRECQKKDWKRHKKECFAR